MRQHIIQTEPEMSIAESKQIAFNKVVDFYWSQIAKNYRGLSLVPEEQEGIRLKAVKQAKKYWIEQGESLVGIEISSSVLDAGFSLNPPMIH